VGLRGTGSDRYSVTDLFIPDRHTVLRDPQIAPHELGRLYCFSSSNMYAVGVAGVALGTARGRNYRLQRTRDREGAARGPPTALRKPGDPVAASAGRSSAQLVARLPAQQSRRDLGSGWRDWRGEPGTEHIIRLAATWAIDQAREVVNTLYHSAGATAIFDNRQIADIVES
jgi:hypothetical protein